jgi:aminoglycoside phosphotransferase (APT) family kinase protein
MNKLNITFFNPENHELLGKGVWGKVYDLKDNTVLKIAKRSGGVGDGVAKVEHEKNVLITLANFSDELPFFLPVFQEYGMVDKGSLADAGYAVWMRSTKIPGVVYTIETLSAMNGDQLASMSQSLGETLFYLHDAFDRSSISAFLKPDRIYEDVSMFRPLLSAEDLARFDKALVYLIQQQSNSLRPIHGDFNISNILWQDKDVSGVLDFAETCLGTIEDDICSLTSELPMMRDDLISAYERISGKTVDKKRLFFSEMKRDLCGLLICGYKLDRTGEADENRQKLDNALSLSPKFL